LLEKGGRALKEKTMAWTTPTLIEICIGLEINGYLPAEFWSLLSGFRNGRRIRGGRFVFGTPPTRATGRTTRSPGRTSRHLLSPALFHAASDFVVFRKNLWTSASCPPT